MLGLGLTCGGCCGRSTWRTSALAFLGGYLSYQMSSHLEVDPLLTLLVIVPLFFVLGAAHAVGAVALRVSPFNSLLVTFGITVIIEALHPGRLDGRLPQAGVELQRA
jgi:branched-chain amino acid transport system permease protein